MRLIAMINECNNIVFFGGAGVSVPSGIPDFRSSNGIYQEVKDYAPEEILSKTFFLQYPILFYEFYGSKMIYKDAQPNRVHDALTKLEARGKLKAIITQNIDGLHQISGSKNVLELHGSINRNYCMKCKASYDLDYLLNNLPLPKCKCGGLIKPDVTLYEEALNADVLTKALSYIQNAEMLIVGGTSLSVYPAAGLIDYFNGKYKVLINKSETASDDDFDLVFHDDIDLVFQDLV